MSDDRTAVAELLRRVPLFHGLASIDLDAVARATRARDAAPGEWIFRQGDPGDTLLIVASGRLEAVIDSGLASEVVLTAFSAGDFFGEMALLTGAARSAGVRAVAQSRLLSLDKQAFDGLAQSAPEMALQLSRVLSSRLSATNEQLSRHLPSSSVVIPLGDARRANEILARTTASIERQIRRGRRHTVSVSDLASVRGSDSVVRRGEMVWLLAADAEGLVVARSHAQGLRDAGIRFRVAYVGARGDAFPEFAGAPFPALRILAQPAGGYAVDPFARALMGATIGVALSGGAAQGTAHVGVLQALVEAGVPIDLIAGTSGGALYGALVAAGLTVDQAKARVIHNTRKNLRDRSDYTLPRTGILRGASIERMIHESTNGARFEDLHFPLYAVAADLATGEEVVIERGPVSHGVRASISVPGIFEPFTIDGRVLVDGGVVNPLPVSVCRSRGANFVIACSVPAPGKLKQDAGATAYNILSVIVRSYYFAGDVIANASAADADILIKPAVNGFGWRDYKSSPAIMEAGRMAGEAAIERIMTKLPINLG